MHEPTYRSWDAAPVSDEAAVQVRGRGLYVERLGLQAPRLTRAPLLAATLLWLVVASLAVQQLLHLGGGGVADLFNFWVNNAAMIGAAGLVAWRAVAFSYERLAWALMAAGLGCYAAGDIVWTYFYGDSSAAVTPADGCYLAWFPFAMASVVLLTRRRIKCFDLHRWIDGIAVALLVATPGVAVVLDPTLRLPNAALAKVVSDGYPIGDIVLIGGAVGVIALTGWRPGRAWLTLTAGLALFVLVDGMYAVQNLEGTYVEGVYDFLWPAATMLVATAAWVRPVMHTEVHAWGWRAVLLPVLCQLLATGDQLWSMLRGRTDGAHILAIAVLAIVTVQLVVSRPTASMQDRTGHLGPGDAAVDDPPTEDLAAAPPNPPPAIRAA